MSLPHYEHQKAFLVPAHDFMGIGGSIKVLDLTYNRHETQDKGPLGRDPNSNWCYLHKQPMAPWTEWKHTRMMPPMYMEPWAETKKKTLYTSMAVTPAPVRVPTQRLTIPSLLKTGT